MDSLAPPLDAVARLAGGPPRAVLPLGGGRNSQVFRLETAAGEVRVLKAYFRHPGDSRDRLAAEFGALSFLWAQGLRCVPEPLGRDPEAALGLYGFILGERPDDPTEAEVDEACAFLFRLRSLGAVRAARVLPEASEAGFSFQAVAENVQLRLDRLAAVDPVLAGDSGLAAFLEGELRPAWRALLEGCRVACRHAGLGFDQALPASARTLSPSDFGFHNALRTDHGLVFLDFEYFGWDDPAKLLADFLLHPGMDLTLRQRQRFAAGVLGSFDVDGLRQRARLAFPLFGIKWCAILLNEFLPGPLDRRRFAGLPDRSARDRQARQLEKTRSKLNHLLDDHAHFPYFSL